MITDKNLIIASNSSAITTSVAVGDVLDLAAIREVGEGKTLYAFIHVNTAFAGGGTVTFQVKSSANNTIAAADTTIGSSPTFTSDGTNLPDNKVVAIKLNPQLGLTGDQYLGLWVATTGTVSTGTIGACVVLDIQDGLKYYPTNIVVDD